MFIHVHAANMYFCIYFGLYYKKVSNFKVPKLVNINPICSAAFCKLLHKTTTTDCLIANSYTVFFVFLNQTN